MTVGINVTMIHAPRNKCTFNQWLCNKATSTSRRVMDRRKATDRRLQDMDLRPRIATTTKNYFEVLILEAHFDEEYCQQDT